MRPRLPGSLGAVASPSSATYLREQRLSPYGLPTSRQAYLILYTDAPFLCDPRLESIQAVSLVSTRNGVLDLQGSAHDAKAPGSV